MIGRTRPGGDEEILAFCQLAPGAAATEAELTEHAAARLSAYKRPSRILICGPLPAAATGKIVALKRLKIDPKDRSGLPVTGLREIQILRDCDHRNVVRLKEVVVGEDTRKIEK